MKTSKLIVASMLVSLFLVGYAVAGSSTNTIEVKESINKSDHWGIAVTGVSINIGDGKAKNDIEAKEVHNEATNTACAISNSAFNWGPGTAKNTVKNADKVENTANDVAISISNTAINASSDDNFSMISSAIGIAKILGKF